MLITFSGIDCCGKTTQISLLEKELAKTGARPRIFWYRPGYSRELDALRKIVRTVFPRILPSPQDDRKRASTFTKPGVSRVWLWMALMDTFFQLVIKLRVYRLIYSHILCDRYLWDAMLDLNLRFPALNVQSWWLSRFLELTVPRPDISLLFLLSKEEMLRRMAVKQEPFPDSPEIRDRRYEAYARMKHNSATIPLNAEDSIYEINNKILRLIIKSGP